jgi:GMP synthase-like glutamine amidotransferase
MTVAEPGQILVVEHEKGCPPALFGAGLTSFGLGLRVVRPYRGESLPQELGDFAGLVVLGGVMAAWEDEVAPWLPAVRRLLARAVAGRVPTLGICLGAQLLALACGGRVERGAAGLEVGRSEVTALPEAGADRYFGPVGDRLGLPHWEVRHFHGDAVTALPPDAELLVTGKVYAHQGFRVGEKAWAVQYHPEVSGDGFRAWAQNGALPDLEVVMSAIRATEPAQELLARAHAAAFAEVIRSA